MDATEDVQSDALPNVDDAPADAPADTGSSWQPEDAAALDAETFEGGDGGASVARCLDLPTSAFVADPVRPLLYASARSAVPGLSYSVVRIDRTTLMVSGAVLEGTNPSALAITDDGAALYVGEDGYIDVDGGASASVRRVDLGSGAVGAAVSVGGVVPYRHAMSVGEIRAVPGSDTRYVVSRRDWNSSVSFEGLALFDGAILLGEWPGINGSGGESITFASPTVLYGFDNETTQAGLYELDVSSSGFQVVTSVLGLLGGYYAEITSQGGWIFSTDGQAIQEVDLQADGGFYSGDAGDYDASGPYGPGPVWPDPNGADVWFLRAPALLDFDRDSFLLKRTFLFPTEVFASDDVVGLVGLGAGNFAFRTPVRICIVSTGP